MFDTIKITTCCIIMSSAFRTIFVLIIYVFAYAFEFHFSVVLFHKNNIATVFCTNRKIDSPQTVGVKQ